MSSSSSQPPNIDALAALAGMYGATKRYVHISFTYPSDLSALGASHFVQPVINTADDWLKYAENCWIVWSHKTPGEWYRQLSAIKELKGCSMLLVGIDVSESNRSGQLPKWVWEWLNKSRVSGSLFGL
jgi:hypothetical protein